MNKKHINALLLAVALVAILVCVFAACDKTAQEDKRITITFDLNDGSAVKEETIDPNDITYAPTRTGYDFVCWTTDKEGTETLDPSKLKNGSVLYAQWKIKTFKVSFYLDEATLVTEATVEYGKGATAPSVDVFKDLLGANEQFTGWNKDFSSVTSDLKVYAVISQNEQKYAVKFVVNGDVVKQTEDNAGNVISLPLETEYSEKIPSGFRFVNWLDENGVEIVQGATLVKDVTYTASFELVAPGQPVLTQNFANGKTEFYYGDVVSVTASGLSAPAKITYSYEWFDESGNKLTASEDGTVCSVERWTAGSHSLTCKATASSDGYTPVSSQATIAITVQKATLTATIAPINISYGDELPAIALSYEGWAFGEEEISFASDSFVTQYEQGKSVGDYILNVFGVSAANYEVKGTNTDGSISATIHVGKRPVAAKTALTFSAQYTGAALSANFDENDFSGLLEGHKLALCLETNGNGVTEYANEQILRKSLTIVDEDGNDALQNYDVTYVASASITPASIRFTTPENQTLTFNGTEQSPSAIAIETSNCTVAYSTSEDGEFSDTLPAFKNAGTYTVYYRIARANYATVSGNFAVVMNKAKATVTANDASVTYGQNFAPSDDAYVTSNLFGENIVVTLSCEYQPGNKVGNYDIVVSAQDNANLDITLQNGSLTVNKATLEIKLASGNSVTYGEAFDFSNVIADEKGRFEGDSLADLIELSTTYKQGDGVKTNGYDIVCTLKDGTNYTLVCEKAALSVTRRKATITVKTPDAIEYGEAANKFEYEISGLYDSDTIACTTSCNYAVGNIPDEYDITVSDVLQNGNYEVETVGAKLTVTKRAITITAKDASVVYGDEKPSFEYTANKSFVENDVPTITFACEYTQGKNVGKYPITLVSSGADHYDITLTHATLTVTKRTLTIKFNDDNVAYNDGEKARFDVSEHAVGVYAQDTISGILQTKSGDKNVYTASGIELGDFEYADGVKIVRFESGQDVSDNYDVRYDVRVEIKDMPIKYEVCKVRTFAYDGEQHNVWVSAQEGATVTYIVNGNEQSDMPSVCNAGEYKFTFRIVKEGLTPVESTFTATVTAKSAKIIVGKQTAVYGENFTLDSNAYAMDGVLEKDEASVSVTLSCDYQKSNDVDSYTISAVANHANYAFSYETNVLEVSAKTVVLDEKTYAVTYGEAAPALTGFTSQSVRVSLDFITLSTDYEQGKFQAEYAVKATSSNANYIVDASKVKLVVNKRTLKLGFDQSTLLTTYGNKANVAYVESGLLDHDGSGMSVEYDIDGGWQTSVGVLGAGTYAVRIRLSDDILAKYEISSDSVQNATLTVQKATLNVGIEQNSLNIVFGEDTNFSATYNGFVNGENESVLQGTLAFTCAYNTQKHAGNFPVTMSGLSSSNYEIVYADDAVLTVDKAKVTITAKNQSAVYGEAFTLDETAYEIKATSGKLLDDITVTLVCSYAVGGNAGSHDITLNVGDYADYDITTIGATLTVSKATYTSDAVQSALVGYNLNNLKGVYTPHTSISAFKNLNGTGFVWANEDENISCTKNSIGYAATYCADPTNYNAYSLSIFVNLEKANPNLALEGTLEGTLEYDWDGNAIDYVGKTTAQLRSDNTDGGFTFTVVITFPTVVSEVKDGGVYTLTATISETANYKPDSIPIILKVKAAEVNGTKYTVEDAIDKVQQGGGTVKLTGNAFIANNLTIPSGTTLILPSGDTAVDDTYTTIGKLKDAAYNHDGARYYVDTDDSMINFKLTVLNGIDITVAGNILIQGLMGSSTNSGQPYGGHTAGKHSQIINNGTMAFKNGSNLDVRGYIKGTGEIILQKGAKYYGPFVVLDYRGGSYSKGCYNKDISPFSQYEMPNIQCNMRIYYGASVTGYCELYALDASHYTTTQMIGSDGIIRLGPNGYVDRTYDRNAQKTTLTIVGEGCTLGSLSLKVKFGLTGSTVEMEKVYFPIPWTYNVVIGDGKTATSLTAGYKYKLLTGATLTINSNATLNMSGSAIAYSSFDNSGLTYGGDGNGYPSKSPAAVNVYGTLNVTGSFGGIITNTNLGAKVSMASANSVSSKEVVSVSKASMFSFEATYETKTESARFSDGTAIEKGKTYTYNGSSWTVG